MNDIVSSGPDNVTGARCTEHPSEQVGDDGREAFYALLMEAARLVDTIGDQAARDRENYEAGWKDAAEIFFRHGQEVGYAQAHEEMANWWKVLAEKVHAIAGTPTFAEIQRRRAEHADAGYTGGPVDWEPRVAEVIELKRGVA